MKKWLTIFMLALVLILAACGAGAEKETDDSGENKAAEEQTSDSPDTSAGEGTPDYPMTVSSTTSSTESRDGESYTFEDVTFEAMPENIVVFDYGFLDTLDALGVEGIVGVAKNSLPDALEAEYSSDDYANIGSLKDPLLEDIAALEPDVIFISGRQSAFLDQLKEITPNVIFVGTQQDDYWNSFKASVDIAVKMFGKQAEAEEHLAKIDSAIEEVNALAENFETSLATLYNEGSLSGYATNSRFGYIYDVFGFTPVTEDIESSSHGSNFGYEAILEFDPEVLFVIDRTASIGGESNIEEDLSNDIIKKTTAYQNDHIVYLDGPLWYLSGGGLQSELAKIEDILGKLK